MKQRTLAVAAVLVLIALAGCTGSGLDPQEAIDGSQAVDDATISIEDDTLYGHLYLADDVQKNDEYCQTVMIGEVPQTQCYDDWQSVEVTSITVEQVNGDWSTQVDASDGEKVTAELPFGSGTYRYYIESQNEPDTYFQMNVTVDSGSAEMVSAGYTDEI